MVEVRWHGRGGQGVVTAAKLLAVTALREGKHIQAFPEFGPERRGAPLQAFTRLDDQRVNIFSHVSHPDIVVVLDRSLVGKTPFGEGLSQDGVLVINAAVPPAEVRRQIGFGQGRLFTVDATRIANETLGKPITNTPMLGAIVKATGLLNLQTLLEEIKDTLGKRLSKDLLEANLAAVRRAYEEVVAG